MPHRDQMIQLAIGHGWRRGVEIGLGNGLLFERLLTLGINMIGVDLGRVPERRARVEWVHSQYPTFSKVLFCASVEAAREVPDKWADFIFIDAGHSYEAVQADIAAWLPKVRDGGWFGGHDYHENFPGVIQAVQEAPFEIDLLEGWIWARR